MVQTVYAYENAQYGFSITPPSGWEQTAIENAEVAFQSPDEEALMSISVDETNDTLTEYADSTKDSLNDVFDDYTPIEENQGKIGGVDSYSIEYEVYVQFTTVLTKAKWLSWCKTEKHSRLPS